MVWFFGQQKTRGHALGASAGFFAAPDYSGALLVGKRSGLAALQLQANHLRMLFIRTGCVERNVC